MAYRHIPNADEDPDYIGHRVIEGKDFSYSLPVYSVESKNSWTEEVLRLEKRPVLIDEIVDKIDMVDGVDPKEIVKESRR